MTLLVVLVFLFFISLATGDMSLMPIFGVIFGIVVLVLMLMFISFIIEHALVALFFVGIILLIYYANIAIKNESIE